VDKFEIGIIVKPQGIKGELRVLPTTFDPSRFSLLTDDDVIVRIDKKGTEKPYRITHARQHKGLVILKFEGIGDRNAAEALVNGIITIPPEKALPLEEDEYYIRDLVGLEVVSEEGESIGRVSKILNTAANDVYIIEETALPDSADSVDSGKGASFMVPAIKDVVRKVDMREGKITIRLMEGLRELKV